MSANTTKSELVLTTFDWVPELPRGFVRDLRVRWALEEAGLPYRVASTPFGDRGATHFAHQPFGQVPWLTDGDISVFESGAILLYIAERGGALMPEEPGKRSEVIEWLFAALNSVEMAALPWGFFKIVGDKGDSPGAKWLNDFLNIRLTRMEAVLSKHEWLVGSFTVADILMGDVLRFVDRFHGLDKAPSCRDYVARATARPAFAKAHADQLAHFAAGDAKRAASTT